MIEEWRHCPQGPNHEVSNMGRVRNSVTGRVLSSRPRKNGYVSAIFKFSIDDQRRYYVHRLVAHAFIRELTSNDVVNHLNFLRSDNRLQNLELTDVVGNVLHSKLAGRLADNGRNTPVGDSSVCSKLNEQQVIEIRRKFATGSRSKSSLASEYGVVKQQIANIVNRVSWKHVL